MKAMRRIHKQSHPHFPVTIYYAFKQSETRDAAGFASTGWEVFLDALTSAGYMINGTWPMRTEMVAALKDTSNVLASSIVLVCSKRHTEAPTTTRREFVSALKA